MVKMWNKPLPKKCDSCGGPLPGGFVDGKTKFGPWGILCLPCHQIYGVGIGLGRGQLYDKTGKKVAG